jgi:hypothetical protein
MKPPSTRSTDSRTLAYEASLGSSRGDTPESTFVAHPDLWASTGPLTALDRDGDQQEVWHEDRSCMGQGVLGHREVLAPQFVAVVGVGEIPQRIATVPTSESSHGEQDDP